MQKFERAQVRNQIAISKHLNAIDNLGSSSEDEDERNEDEIQNVVGSVVSAYQGEAADTERIISYLTNSFQSGSAICLICISTVKKADPIWNCVKCFAYLHLSCILHWIQDSLSYKRQKGIVPLWACPKCRMEYSQDKIPRTYLCFCKKTVDPPYLPWSIPHSCGETCSRLLEPSCGHKCVLLCHPGPCPPCAQMVLATCFCGKQLAQPRRCNAKDWSCGSICKKRHKSCSHNCMEPCHSGECPPCSEMLMCECRCKSNKDLKKCHESSWTCNKPCNKLLTCKVHVCKGICHGQGDCGQCPYEENRTCPCGKKQYAISCRQEQVPTCGDTCGKLLDCRSHFCNMRCHVGKCGQCLEVVTKSCRCGSYEKEVACGKEFHCNKKCMQMRLCGRHQCNRKCCDCLIRNTHNPCEKICENTLNCRKHKCLAPCHSGPCYPCARTDVIQCRCGFNKITVPCGNVKRIKPPRCNKPCKIPPICHHLKRETHKCHQGPCPPCRKICGMVYKRCGHSCVARCHTKVQISVKINAQPAGPWEKTKDMKQLTTLPCPPCEVSVPVTCLGGHETRPWPCYMSKPNSCGKPCGQMLPCKNHSCELVCHKLQKEAGDSGVPCMNCEQPCLFPRPKGCTHPCSKPCHPAPCSPCKQLVRVSCHCSISTLYRRCVDLTSSTQEQRNELLKCGNQCPKNYPCGHRCMNDCHPGACMGESECNKKVKQFCKCKRIKKDFICSVIRKQTIIIECDEVCRKLQKEKEEARATLLERQRQEEELRNQEEIQKFSRKFKPRRKGKDRTDNIKNDEDETHTRKWIWVLAILLCVAAIVLSFMKISYFRMLLSNYL